MDDGIYYDLDEDDYFADPALSQSGAKLLLDCPAKYRWALDHLRTRTDAMRLGAAAHALVLGAGAPLHVEPSDSWRTEDAREARTIAESEGRIPLLAKELDRLVTMTDRVADYFTNGKPEVSLFRTVDDVATKARVDWVDGLTILDYKTTRDASPDGFAKTVANFGYHQQAAWYCDAAQALGLVEFPDFVFVVQESEPPFEFGVYQLDADALDVGRRRNQLAIEIYAECVAWDRWPGYTDDEIHTISLPSWAARKAPVWD